MTAPFRHQILPLACASLLLLGQSACRRPSSAPPPPPAAASGAASEWLVAAKVFLPDLKENPDEQAAYTQWVAEAELAAGQIEAAAETARSISDYRRPLMLARIAKRALLAGDKEPAARFDAEVEASPAQKIGWMQEMVLAESAFVRTLLRGKAPLLPADATEEFKARAEQETELAHAYQEFGQPRISGEEVPLDRPAETPSLQPKMLVRKAGFALAAARRDEAITLYNQALEGIAAAPIWHLGAAARACALGLHEAGAQSGALRAMDRAAALARSMGGELENKAAELVHCAVAAAGIGAKDLSDTLMADAEKAAGQPIELYRPAAYAAVAYGYTRLGRGDLAGGWIRQAAERAAAHRHPMGRAMGTVALCANLALAGTPPDAEMRASLADIQARAQVFPTPPGATPDPAKAIPAIGS